MAFWLVCGLPIAALGNGGGYVDQGVLTQGDLAGFVPEQTEAVQMVEENLLVKMGTETARVEIVYQLVNLTDEDVTVRFGFPVEQSEGMETDEGGEGEEYPTSETQSQPSYCRDYVVTADGQRVQASWEVQPASNDEKRKNLAGWFVSEVEFKAGQQRELRIGFESQYLHTTHSVSESSSSGEPRFKYRLSTAACWRGPIASGRIELRPDGIDPQGLRVLEPEGRFAREGDSWVWKFADLEPALADDFIAVAMPAINSDLRPLGSTEENRSPEGAPWVDFLEQEGKWSMLHRNYAVSASSTLADAENPDRYSAVNLKELGLEVWSEGAEGNGVGAWLELRPEVAHPLVSIRIWPGYQWGGEDKQQGRDLFLANARPRLTRITFNGNHSFEVEIPDRREEVVIPIRDFKEPVESVRLEFLSVWPGTRHEDLCVSRIGLEVALDEEPYISPQR